MTFDPARLQVQLLNTGLQRKDQPLYQLLNQMIQALSGLTAVTSGSSGSGGGGGSTIINNTIVQQFLNAIDGIDGEDGVPGLPGPAGSNGTIGRDGNIGPPGMDGMDGDEGFPIPGPQGIQGPAGSSGSSITRGTFASRPAAGHAGNLYLPTDAPFFEFDDGAAWDNVGPVYEFTTPTDPGTWVNQGTTTLTVAKDSLLFVGGAAGSGTNVACRIASSGATPWSYTVFMEFIQFAKSFNSFGLCFRESSSSKLAIFDILGVTNSPNAVTVLRSTKFTNATTFSADYQTVPIFLGQTGVWLRIQDNGSSRICSISADGQNFITFHSIGRTDFLTADQYGIVIGVENSATPQFAPLVTVLSALKA